MHSNSNNNNNNNGSSYFGSTFLFVEYSNIHLAVFFFFNFSLYKHNSFSCVLSYCDSQSLYFRVCGNAVMNESLVIIFPTVFAHIW